MKTVQLESTTTAIEPAANDLPQVNFITLIRGGHKQWNEWINTHPEVVVDFSDCDFNSKSLRTLSFARCQFPDNTLFVKARFRSDVTFKNARFGRNCSFAGSTM